MSFGTVMSTIGNVLGGLTTGVSSILGTVDQIKTNDLNYKLQRNELAYQKDLQKIMFAREDNAVQRRVNDLKAAGLSPTLAAGSSAGAGSVVSTTAQTTAVATTQATTVAAEPTQATTQASSAYLNVNATSLIPVRLSRHAPRKVTKIPS